MKDDNMVIKGLATDVTTNSRGNKTFCTDPNDLDIFGVV